MSRLTHANLPLTTFEVVTGNVGPYLQGEQFTRELTYEEAKRLLDAGTIQIVYQGKDATDETPEADPLVTFAVPAEPEPVALKDQPPPDDAKSARTAKEGK